MEKNSIFSQASLQPGAFLKSQLVVIQEPAVLLC